MLRCTLALHAMMTRIGGERHWYSASCTVSIDKEAFLQNISEIFRHVTAVWCLHQASSRHSTARCHRSASASASATVGDGKLLGVDIVVCETDVSTKWRNARPTGNMVDTEKRFIIWDIYLDRGGRKVEGAAACSSVNGGLMSQSRIFEQVNCPHGSWHRCCNLKYEKKNIFPMSMLILIPDKSGIIHPRHAHAHILYKC